MLKAMTSTSVTKVTVRVTTVRRRPFQSRCPLRSSNTAGSATGAPKVDP